MSKKDELEFQPSQPVVQNTAKNGKRILTS